LRDLTEKSRFVQWHNGERKEYFGLAAKTADGKERLRKKGFVIFDLDDF